MRGRKGIDGQWCDHCDGCWSSTSLFSFNKVKICWGSSELCPFEEGSRQERGFEFDELVQCTS
ncbi:BQ5605_C013g07093 [Microbotryum silenes-dioicae]|uniref:BQ5605_C013g07093 protein n=1 Tax=Microbotryum silenes-dioicae TaxID=796604 RepID=A0A2X0NNA9_9BASI|nr:BQ5605_C013g07093 [Microbotryum silenes-dioicae]